MRETVKRSIQAAVPVVLRLFLPVLSLALITLGFYMLYPPLAPLVLGALVWWDLRDWSKAK